MEIPENAKRYLILNGIVIIVLAIYLLKRSSKKKGFLSFERFIKPKSELVPAVESETVKLSHTQPTESRKDWSQILSDLPAPAPRELNVFFNHNGHTWEAFEVLGLPAGSSAEKVEESYRYNLKQVDNKSRSFIDMAYDAIISSQKADSK